MKITRYSQKKNAAKKTKAKELKPNITFSN